MEEHRELVEDERGACAEHDCQERDPELAWLEGDGEAAGDEAHHAAWHEVVHVHVGDVCLVPREEAKEVHPVSTTIVRVYDPGPASDASALVWARVRE